MIIRSIVRTIFLAALLLPSCKKEARVVTPVIRAILSPESGNTTHKFKFDLSRSESRTGKGSKVFTRWDWDGDGNWDTPFTRLLVYEHRYYIPGIWKPRLEMTNIDGGCDSMSFTIPVQQGQSPPKVELKIVPGTGHVLTRFLLDASASRDDEDSLDQLNFRWDFEGDGLWNTDFGDSVTIFHDYPETGIYTVRVQVRDPSGLIGTAVSELIVTLEDPGIIANFNWMPDSITNDTPIIMDASLSIDPDSPDKPLQYRWDWNNDRVWDTGWLNSPQTEYIFKEEFIHFVRLQVKSHRGLTKDMVKSVKVHHKNTPPKANFSAQTFGGNVNTEFRLDCWLTRDLESAPSDLFYRWDFDGDGRWDTDYSGKVVTMHRFEAPGIYHTKVLVKDPLGEQDTCSKAFYVSKGTNETGILLDIRGVGYEYYGTVAIGDQWWLTRNTSIHDTVRFYQFFYNHDWWSYFDYGNLYLKDFLTNICPNGWRVPSREDFDKLFSNYPKDQLYEALMPGGISDFAATLAGMGTGTTVKYSSYKGMDLFGYYWTTTKPLGASSPSTWVITFDRPGRQVLSGYYDEGNKQYSVRCVKDK